MGVRRAVIATLACVAALTASPLASASTSFRPRIGAALGLVPTLRAQQRMARADIATGAPIPVTYHGGSVMAGGVTVHTIFWAPSGYAFEGSPGNGIPTYEGLIKQFLTNVAQASGAGGTCSSTGCDAYSVLPQFAEGTSVGAITPGNYSISYDQSADSVDDTNPYPARPQQCASPSGTDTCLTDGQVEAEIDRVIQSTPGTPRGLNNLWFVFLPPNVDECVTAGSCGTNAFAGYHAISNLNGHGLTIYTVAIDPIIELQVPPGADPNGFPDAEATLDTAAHEVVEAITDPEGAGWMDPSGFEVGDKCDVGPQVGTPLGFASDGSPYNQVIDSHQYLIQDFWANLDSGGYPGCVQATTDSSTQLPLPQVNVRQFNPVVSGNVNRVSGAGIGVQVTLLRAGAGGSPVAVARGTTTTAANGAWSVSLAPHAPGDDRDEIDVDYSGAGAPLPHHQVILTGNGGNPFNEAGWTGWLAADAGAAVTGGSGGSAVTLAPCFQTGVLSLSVNGILSPNSPTDFCNTQTDAGTVPVGLIRPQDVVTATSNDNRAFSPPDARTPNPAGGLVSLTVLLGEPGAAPQFTSPLAPLFTPTGVPSCTADLELDAVLCAGLVSGKRYTVSDGRQHAAEAADANGTVLTPLVLSGGDSVALSNGSRTLTTLHVAHLRVTILGDETVLGGGRCQPGEYYGTPLGSNGTAPPGEPTTSSNGGVSLTGEVCPVSGKAAGLPAATIAQVDDRSGGLTETEVPDVADTSPIEGETVYGSFVLLAETGIQGASNSFLPTDFLTVVSASIAPVGGGRPVFRAANVDTLYGATVPALFPGSYVVTWKVTDVNGDMRIGQTRFVERLGRGPASGAGIACAPVRGHLNQVRCGIRFSGSFARATGRVRVRIARGGKVVALGHGSVRKGRATVTMRRLRQVGSGGWKVTLVLSVPGEPPRTIVVRPKRLL